MKPLQGKVAIVTGGSRGIGAAIVRSLAERGANICFNYTSESSTAKSHDLVQQMQREHGINITSIRADLATPDGPAQVIEHAKAHFSHTTTSKPFTIDILINNAGVCPALLIPDCTPAAFDTTYKINVLAPLLLVQAALPYLPHDRSGRILNISSIAAHVGTQGQSIYGGSKAALDAMTRTWARELAERATVLAIHAGPVLTDMVPVPFVAEAVGLLNRSCPLATPRRGVDSEEMLKAAATIGGRVAYDGEIAELIAHFTGPEVGWMTGHVVGADGGFDFIR